MINRSSADFGQFLRAPDLRLGEVRNQLLSGAATREHRIGDPSRGILVHVLHGAFTLEVEGSSRPPIEAPQGTSAGFAPATTAVRHTMACWPTHLPRPAQGRRAKHACA